MCSKIFFFNYWQINMLIFSLLFVFLWTIQIRAVETPFSSIFNLKDKINHHVIHFKHMISPSYLGSNGTHFKQYPNTQVYRSFLEFNTTTNKQVAINPMINATNTSGIHKKFDSISSSSDLLNNLIVKDNQNTSSYSDTFSNRVNNTYTILLDSAHKRSLIEDQKEIYVEVNTDTQDVHNHSIPLSSLTINTLNSSIPTPNPLVNAYSKIITNQDYHSIHSSSNKEFHSSATCVINDSWTNEEMCLWARSCGSQESIIPYNVIAYCYFNPPQISILFFFPWAVILFYLGGCVCDDYFTPPMVRIASIMGLSDPLAGCTLLAFANGAGDLMGGLSAALSGTDALDIFVGDVFGACIFLTTVVYGAVLCSSRESIVELNHKASLRDIFFYLLSLSIFFSFSLIKTVPLWAPLPLLLLYSCYVYVAVKQGNNTSDDKLNNSIGEEDTESIIDSHHRQHPTNSPQLITQGENIIANPITHQNSVHVVPDVMASSNFIDKQTYNESSTLLQVGTDYRTKGQEIMKLQSGYQSTLGVPICPLSYTSSSSPTALSVPNNYQSSSLNLYRNSNPPHITSSDASGHKVQSCRRTCFSTYPVNIKNQHHHPSQAAALALLTRPGKRFMSRIQLEAIEDRQLYFDMFVAHPVEALESFRNSRVLSKDERQSLFKNGISPIDSQPNWFLYPVYALLNLTIPRIGSEVPPVWNVIYPFTITAFILCNHAKPFLPLRIFYMTLFGLFIGAIVMWVCYSLFPIKRAILSGNKEQNGMSLVHVESGLFKTSIAAFMSLYWNCLLVTEVMQNLMTTGKLIGVPNGILGLTIVAWGNCTADFFANVGISKSGYTSMALSGAYGSSIMLLLFGTSIVSLTSLVTGIFKGSTTTPRLHMGYSTQICIVLEIVVGVTWLFYATVKKFAVPRLSGLYLLGGFIVSVIIVLTLMLRE